ncbi:hypothetical protein [Magnetospirillum sp. 15-1]|uniref:hypothetical protein n=1 Tax=Magnetospirillum sp. 15-1 TaxID=1979370 RepID=UPI0011423AFD|nr:hypothetical protein [Magnetospirillum sp. 15-1]
MESHYEAHKPSVASKQISKMSPGRHFEEDPPRIDNDEEWEELIEDMVLQFEPFYEAKTNTDENAINRVMSAYRIVLKALSDPEGFDVRCTHIKVKVPKADVQNPVFHRAIEFNLATIAKRKSVPFNKRAVKDTITCYSRVCHWLHTRQPPLLENSARDQLTTVGINAIEKLWLQENKKADAPKPRKPTLPKKVVQEVWDAIKDLPPPSPGHRSISFTSKQAVRNYLDGVDGDEEATSEDTEPVDVVGERGFIPAGFTLDKFLTKENFKKNPEYLVLFPIYPFLIGFCDHNLALNCYEGHNEYRTRGDDILKRTGGSPISCYMVSDEDNSIYEDHMETVVGWLNDNYESIKPSGSPPPSGDDNGHSDVTSDECDDTDPDDDPPPSGGEEAPATDLENDSDDVSVTGNPSPGKNGEEDNYPPEPTEVEKAIAGASNLLMKIINELPETDFEDVNELVEHYKSEIVSRDDVLNALREGTQTGLIFFTDGSVIGTVNLHNWLLHDFRRAAFYADFVARFTYNVKMANAFIHAASKLKLIYDEHDEDDLLGGRTIQFSDPRVSLLAQKNPKILAKLRTNGKHMAEFEVASNRDCVYHKLLGEDRCGGDCVGTTKFVKMFPSLSKAKKFCDSLSEFNSYAVYKVMDATTPFEDIMDMNEDESGTTSVIKTAYAQFRENHCQLEYKCGYYEADATDSPYRF